ncbi:MAG: sulfofructose kinase [Abditibacteriota bacterium]|nr:sulfofructose kinase [Abditibacteriota bacterium]
MNKLDVLGLGAVAVDDLIFVDEYPAADSKVRVREALREGGGLCGTALVAASRLGARCAYIGVLGDDDLSRFTRTQLEQEGIDCTKVLFGEDARPHHSTIIVDRTQGTRTIFSDERGTREFPIMHLPPQLIEQTRVLFVDHTAPIAGRHAAQLAREAGIPVVADIERLTSPDIRALVPLVDHLIVGLKLGRELTGKDEPAQIAKQLGHGRAAAVVTDGEHGCWACSAQEPHKVLWTPSFAVEVVDTTGCGDVFHGAYAATLARNEPLPARLETASACAALKARQPGGRRGIPQREELESFVRNRHL